MKLLFTVQIDVAAATELYRHDAHMHFDQLKVQKTLDYTVLLQRLNYCLYQW